MKTLFISDLDGTLLNSNAEISENTFRIINNLIAKGVYFTIATARSERSAIPMTENININVPMILMNGATIFNPVKEFGFTRQRKEHYWISKETSLKISDIYDKHGIKGSMYRIYWARLLSYSNYINEDKFRFQYCESFREEITKSRYSADCDSPIYFTANDEYDVLLPMKNDIEKLEGIKYTFYKDTYTGKWFLEIFSENASKANGIKFLRKKYGFDKVVCFGDNLNDITMFNESDIRVAVANAKPELKSLADFVTLSNDDDGVAVWLEKNYKEFLYE